VRGKVVRITGTPNSHDYRTAEAVSVVRSSRDELLAAVDVVRRARECCVAHDVNG
jgi:hypothetical protein